MYETVRRFTEGDLEFALRQTRREGWTTHRGRLAMLLAHDPDGCFVAEWDGKPVGMVTTTAFATGGWVGNVIVEPAYRGRGIGRRLVERGLERLEVAGLGTVRLDGDPPGVPLYRRLGFADEYLSLRYVATGPWPAARGTATGLEESDWPGLLALDREGFGDDRGRLLAMLRRDAAAALVVRRNGGLEGYAFLTGSRIGLQLGPCVASSPEAGAELVRACLARCGPRHVVVGVPEPCLATRELLESLGFSPVAPSLRMVRGASRAAGTPSWVHGIASGATG